MQPIQAMAAYTPAPAAYVPTTPVMPLLHVGQTEERMRRDAWAPRTHEALAGLREAFPQVRELGPLGDKAKSRVMTAAGNAQHICRRARDFLLREPSFEPSGDLGNYTDFRQLTIRDAYLGANAFGGSPARTAMLDRIAAISGCLATLQTNIDDHVLIRTAQRLPTVAAATKGDGRVALDRQLRTMDNLAQAGLLLDLAQEACQPTPRWQAVDVVMKDGSNLAAHVESARWLSNDITDGIAEFDDRLAAAAHALDNDVFQPAPMNEEARTRLLQRYRSDPAFRVRLAASIVPVSLVLTDIASQQAVSGRAIDTAMRIERTGVLQRVRAFFGSDTTSADTAVAALRAQLGTHVTTDDAVVFTLAFLQATPRWTWPVSVPLASGMTATLSGTAHRGADFTRTPDGLFVSGRRPTPRADFADALFAAMNSQQREAVGVSSASHLRLQLQAYAMTLDDNTMAAMLFERSAP